ncbi:SusC/RagA family TonB-linked outer membrane protein [Pedobacter yulinensis]|uniref:SusC/RagA family TonB-linked outer membrane protein n=1 Tax=Pedobacter yulinensis TaxID=2126353 RepID=A0A2T3HLT8_9SPHI|nr:SusC/RagA family TonB-linked outer membrane protein [Pedobacter yulinensis]PST83394.1 SusC/RagA family TonB-linked outer membrane protein [Pedobacter yulinensis]
MKKTLLSLLGILLLSWNAIAQQKNVSGTVRDQGDGQPIPGVSVRVSGSQTGTSTNADGTYTISVQAGASLVFSSVGYVTQTRQVGSGTTLNVELASDSKELSEVVVTALGITRKKNELAYAAQEVRAEDITRTRDNNLVNSLGGKVAGLDIRRNNTMGGSTNVVIRGFKSISGNNQALFVIDGVPVSNANINTANQQTGRAGFDYGNAAADINPDDVESMNVLKGAAATALYGSRAANGVIIITTKKGRKGSTNFSVNSGLTWGNIDKTTFPEYQKEYGAGYGTPATDGAGNPVPVPGFWYRDIFGNGKELITQFTSDASYGPRFNPSLLVYQWGSLDPSSPTYKQKTPWVAAANGPDKFYETALVSNQSIAIDGGGENTTYKVGYTRNDENGVLPNSKITKNLFNFGASREMAKNLRVEASANYSRIEGLGRYGTGYANLNPNQNFRQWYQTNVDMLELKDAFFRNRRNITWNWSDATGTRPIYADNPYFTRYKNLVTDSRNHFFGNITATYKFAEWLDVLGRVTYDGTGDLQEERIAVGSYAVSSYARTNRNASETNYDLLLNFKHDFSEVFTFRGLLGANLRRDNVNSIRAQTNGGLVAPDLYSLLNSVSPIEAPVEIYQRRAVDGHFASATFGYRNMLVLDATIRRDVSSTLPTTNNEFWYPSVAAGFTFSELMKQQTWLSYGKLRVNYAQVGNDAPPLSVYDVYTKPTSFDVLPLFSVSNTKNNPALRPERTRSLEAGVEASFFKSRLGFDVTLYRTLSIDQITPVSVSSATGYTARYVNAGEVENKGIELSLYGTPVKTQNFSWNINLNFTSNRNIVLKLDPDAGGNIELAALQGGVTLNAAEGQPYGVIRGTDFVYLNGQPVVLPTGYYKVTTQSNHIIGDPNPDFMAGLQNGLKYKNIALNFLIDMRQGGDLFSLDQWYGNGTGLYPGTAGLNDLGNPLRNTLANGGGIILPGVKEDGTPNNIRVDASTSAITPFGYSQNPPRAMRIYDASYIKLREVSLSYALPARLVEKIRPFKGVEASLIGRNLWIIHKNVPYADPEDALSSGNLSGYQSGSYPAVRTIGFNLRFKL